MMSKFMNDLAYSELDSFDEDILLQSYRVTMKEDGRSVTLTTRMWTNVIFERGQRHTKAIQKHPNIPLNQTEGILVSRSDHKLRYPCGFQWTEYQLAITLDCAHCKAKMGKTSSGLLFDTRIEGPANITISSPEHEVKLRSPPANV